MNEPILFPDAVQVVKAWLDTKSLGADVVGVIPNPRPNKLVHVRRIGGQRRGLVIDMATVAIDSWAKTEIEAHSLALLVRAHVGAMGGQSVEDSVVYRVIEFAGPADIPDPDSDSPRTRQTFQVGLRGNAIS